MFPEEIEKELDGLYVYDQYNSKYANLSARPSEKLLGYFAKNHGIRTDVHRMCQNCQIMQISKYRDFKHNSYEQGKFEVRCGYVPDGLPPGSMNQVKKLAIEKDIDLDRAKKIFLSTVDPVAWAELMFGFDDSTIGTDNEWYLRPYQKEQLRCTSLRIVMREGRRVGKTFVMCLKLIYLALNTKIPAGIDPETGKEVYNGPQIMVITPFQSQIDNIFEEMEKLLKRSKILKEQVAKGAKGSLFAKTPFYSMEFLPQSENGVGATISGFVSGVGNKQDGSGGGTMRGESADLVYLDEMDMISDSIMKSVIKPLLLTRKNVKLFGTSNPIGKRSAFWTWCTARPDFREFYFPSTVLTNWEDVLRDIDDPTEESFKAEYLARFIDGSYGVFKPSLIHEARSDYSYEDTFRPGFWASRSPDPSQIMYTIGVDWNKNAGTEFYVIAYDPLTSIFWGVEATNIPSSRFSAEAWKEELKRLNYKWKPDFIYADDGYGHTIIEDLRFEAHRLKNKRKKTPIEEETVKLVDRLVSFNFSANVELRDPVTRKTIKKPGKYYLVETAVRVFESKRIQFPEGDDSLIKQLQHYVTLRVSDVTGKPVYGPDNAKIGDHRLDALMLSIIAVYMERSAYAKALTVGSMPEMYTREDLNVGAIPDYVPATKQAQNLLNEIQDHNVPIAPNVLAIVRGGSHEEDRAALEKYRAKSYFEDPRSSRKRARADILDGDDAPEPPPSAYARDEEDLWRYKRVTSGGVVQRRRSVKRRMF